MTTHYTHYDALIIGGGHNGLVCACYLASRGMRVRVLERRSIVGGAAVTEEFHPGFRNSTASYTVSLLNPTIIRDLNLHAHGLHVVERPFSNFLPLSALPGDYIKVGGGLAATQVEVARFSQADAAALPGYYAMLDRVAAVLKDLLLETPPNIGGGATDIWQAIKLGKRFKALDMAARAMCWIYSPRARAICSMHGLRPRLSKRASVSIVLWGILRRPIRRGRRMCCYIMCLAR